MNIDIDKAITNVIKTGKVSFGIDSALKGAKTGKVKLIVLAANCPRDVREDIEYYAKLSEVPLMMFRGSSHDLASACGKPFSVSALSIREPGDSDILRVTEKPKEEEEFAE